jgi:hypothetical protein
MAAVRIFQVTSDKFNVDPLVVVVVVVVIYNRE